MQRHLKPAALAAAMLSVFNAQAADETIGPEVIVIATRDASTKPNPAQDATVIDRTSIEQSASQSVAEILANEAGIEITTNGGPASTTGIFIRGIKPAQSVVLIDGFRLVNPTDGTAPIEGLPLSMMERIEVIRGGASGIYGSGAIGGAVQLFTRNPNQAPAMDASVTTGRYGTYRTDAGYGGKFGDNSFYMALGADGSEGFSATKPSSPDFDPDKDGYRRESVMANFQHDLGNGQAIRFNALSTDAHTKYDSQFAPSAPSVDSQVQLLGVTYDAKFSDTWRAEFKLGETRYDYQYKNAGFAFSPNTDDFQFAWMNHLTLPSGKLTLGLEREQQKVTGTGTSYLKNERNINSAFAQWQGSYGAHEIQAALRNDRWTDYGGQSTGNVLYAYGVASGWSLTAALAKAFRAPTFDDLYFPFGSNPALVPENSRSAEAGARYKNGGDEVRLVAFRNRIENAIELDASFIPQNIQALIKGWTASWNHCDSDWRWSAAFTHQDPKDLGTGDQLVRRAHNIATASAERQIGAWRIGSELRSQDERYTQSPNAGNFRMGGYGLVNTYASYVISPTLTAQARVDNVTDKRYELVKDYNTPGRSLFLTLRYSSM
ncbi:MAG: TonB-dependent receptor [Georgfuchsia sp.]